MTDEELADAVVALGIFTEIKPGVFHIANAIPLGADVFVRDWRVAGAIMERLAKDDELQLRAVSLAWHPRMSLFAGQTAGFPDPVYGAFNERMNESAPRAIIEACVEAMK